MGKQAERETDRKARIAAMRAEQQRAERRRTLIWSGLTAGVVVVLVVGVVWAIVSSRPKSAAAAPLTGLVTYSNLSRDHVDGPVTYAQTPPAGGKHSSVWQNCGEYSSPVQNEHAVHSLEHGAMWITYQPNLPKDQLKILEQDLKGQRYGLLSPYPGLPTQIVATVWGTQLRLTSASDGRLKTFIAKYADGSKAPEPNGECTGGTGTPTPLS